MPKGTSLSQCQLRSKSSRYPPTSNLTFTITLALPFPSSNTAISSPLLTRRSSPSPLSSQLRQSPRLLCPTLQVRVLTQSHRLSLNFPLKKRNQSPPKQSILEPLNQIRRELTLRAQTLVLVLTLTLTLRIRKRRYNRGRTEKKRKTVKKLSPKNQKKLRPKNQKK